MTTSTVEWLEGDSFWSRVDHVLACVIIAVAVVQILTLLQVLGVVALLPYSTLSPTGSLIQVGWIGILLVFVFVRSRFPIAGPIGLSAEGLSVRGYLRRWTIPRSRIVRVDRRGLVFGGWFGGRLVLTPGQSERLARWFYSPNST